MSVKNNTAALNVAKNLLNWKDWTKYIERRTIHAAQRLKKTVREFERGGN